ncbi:MAG TPA: CHAD domain-containing protein [Bryobacteraceae bacterium]|jgi:CHAD domain-containing protein
MLKNPALGAEAKARERLRILAVNLRRAAKDPGDPDSIHDLRVSIRRFKQVLRVFDGLFSHSPRMRRGLREIMDLCGAARNCDIASDVLDAAGVPLDHGLRKRLKQYRAHAGRDLAKLLDKWDVHAHMRRWQGWLATEAGEALPARSLPSLAREFFAAGRAAAKASATVRQMHAFRLSVKRFRYTLEILGGKAPSGIRMDAVRGLQDRLGAINDCVTTAELIDEIHRGAAGKREIKAALNRLIAHRSADFRIYWRTHFNRRTK